jgi:hypothetical protein
MNTPSINAAAKNSTTAPPRIHRNVFNFPSSLLIPKQPYPEHDHPEDD